MTTTNKQEPLGGEKIEQIRALLSEAYSFKSTSPAAQQNINAALDLLDTLASSQQAGAAGASEVKTWQERCNIPMPEPHEMRFSMREIHRAKDAEIADLRAQLASAQQAKEYEQRHAAESETALAQANAQLAQLQAPVGESIDTPEFWRVVEGVRFDASTRKALIAHINAWYAAQIARQHHGSGEPVAKCDTCNGTGVVDDGEIDCYSNGEPYMSGPIKCVKDCPACRAPAAQADEVLDAPSYPWHPTESDHAPSNLYRKKPVVVRAVKWYGWTKGPHDLGITRDHHSLIPDDHFGWIATLEGGHIVTPGDWIITGVHGEKYPCKPDIFEKTYEPAALRTTAADNQKGDSNA